MDQKVEEEPKKPELTPELEQEWQQLLTEMEEAQTTEQELPQKFYTQLRQLYLKILQHWSLTPKPTLCQQCHQSIPKQLQPNSWTFEYSQQQSLPLWKFWCQQCKNWTTEQYETLH